MIDGKQCAVPWHVDDLKISHVDPNAQTTIIGLIDEEFGKESPITVARGKAHDYLGMTLDHTVKGKVKVKMIDSVAKMVNDLPEEFDGEAATPAGDDLFKIDEDLRAPPRHCSHASAQGPICRQRSHFCAKG
jgi:hypothetical protein